MKTCTICLVVKPFEDFHTNPRMKDGYLNQCRKCKYARRHADSEQRQKSYAATRKWKLKNLYGVTVEQYDEMWLLQEGRCAICKEPDPSKNLSVDHDHVTGQARKLLCTACNFVIGNARERIDILENAIEYLKSMKAKGLSS